MVVTTEANIIIATGYPAIIHATSPEPKPWTRTVGGKIIETALYATLAPNAIRSSTDIMIKTFDCPSFKAFIALESDAEFYMID